MVNSTSRERCFCPHALVGSALGSFSISLGVKFTISFPKCPAVPLGPLYLLLFARCCLSCSYTAAVSAGPQFLHSCSHSVYFSAYKLIFKKSWNLSWKVSFCCSLLMICLRNYTMRRWQLSPAILFPPLCFAFSELWFPGVSGAVALYLVFSS